jgi:RNA polymerase subunit RPABC4/transcription elongation factor Spt4
MRECANCHSHVEDHVLMCPQCKSDLTIDSMSARALDNLMASPRVSGIYLAAPTFACPVCRNSQGTFEKNLEAVPALPHDGCSCPNGCVCRYEPLSFEVGP